MKTALIITTINIPTVLALYAKLDAEVEIIVAADLKTPPEAEAWFYDNCAPKQRLLWLSVEAQRDLNYKSSELIGFSNDSRRNIALLEAVRSGAELIISCDDDMVPCTESFFYDFTRLFEAPFNGLQCGEPGYWFDPGRYTIPPAKARGLPVDTEFVDAFSPAVGVQIGAAQGIILGIPDSDAMTAITNEPKILSVTDVLRNGFVVHPEALTVFDSQITAFRRELAPCFGQFYKFHGRNTDIMASMLMRRVMCERGLYTHFGPPSALHARRSRPLFNDLKAELFGLQNIVPYSDWLNAARLVGDRTVAEHCRDLMLGMVAGDREAMMAWYDDIESVL